MAEREPRLDWRWPNWRLVASAVVVCILVGLLVWQARRQRLIADCLDMAGQWNGPQSRCEMPPGRILVQPGLGRG